MWGAPLPEPGPPADVTGGEGTCEKQDRDSAATVCLVQRGRAGKKLPCGTPAKGPGAFFCCLQFAKIPFSVWPHRGKELTLASALPSSARLVAAEQSRRERSHKLSDQAGPLISWLLEQESNGGARTLRLGLPKL